MFAKMRNGKLKKILYAQAGAGVIKNRSNFGANYKPSWGELFIGIPYNLPRLPNKLPAEVSVSDTVVEDTYKGSGTEEKPKNSPSTVKPKIIPKKKPPPPDKDTKDLGDKIKKGDLDELIKERIDIFEKYLGGDGTDQIRQGGFAAMTEFGLNLASARGGNLMDKIARSAKDPVKTFTAIGMAAKDRADKIKMAGVEAGIEAEQTALDRAAEGDDTTTTFQKNLATLTEMFSVGEGENKKLIIDQEDLVNMAKAGGTTSKKEFFTETYKAFAGKMSPVTGEEYSPQEIEQILEQGWALVSGQAAPESSPGSQSTGTTVVEEESIDTILDKYK